MPPMFKNLVRREQLELFSAWMDGLIIQVYMPAVKAWVDVSRPGWIGESQYRLKTREGRRVMHWKEGQYSSLEGWILRWEVKQQAWILLSPDGQLSDRSIYKADLTERHYLRLLM